MEMIEEPPETIDFGGQAEQADDLAHVTIALAGLRPVERRVLCLSVHEGKSHSEVSTELEMPLGTVKSHLRRAILRVREVLGIVGEEKA